MKKPKSKLKQEEAAKRGRKRSLRLKNSRAKVAKRKAAEQEKRRHEKEEYEKFMKKMLEARLNGEF